MARRKPCNRFSLYRHRQQRTKNLFSILLRGPDLAQNGTQNPHVLQYIPFFPCRFVPTEARSLQIVKQVLRQY
jgi:hypothetical protein